MVSLVWSVFVLYLAVVGHNVWRLLNPQQCDAALLHTAPHACIQPLHRGPLELRAYASPSGSPTDAEHLGEDDSAALLFSVTVTPGKLLEHNATLPFTRFNTRNNGSLHAHLVLRPAGGGGVLTYLVAPITRHLPLRVVGEKRLLRGAAEGAGASAAAPAVSEASGARASETRAAAVAPATSCVEPDDDSGDAGGGTCANPLAPPVAPAVATLLPAGGPVTHVRPRLVVRLAHPSPALLRSSFPPDLHPFLVSDPAAPGRLSYRPLAALDEAGVLRREWRAVRLVVDGGRGGGGAAAAAAAPPPDPVVLFRVSTPGPGLFSLYRQLEGNLRMLGDAGFSEADLEELQELVSGSNLRWWALTTAVSLLHAVFSYLAFASDVGFWRGKTRLEGLSIRSFFSSFVCQSIIFLKLLDGGAWWPCCGPGRLLPAADARATRRPAGNVSRLLLAEVGVGVAIEGWKVAKILTRRGWLSVAYLRRGTLAAGTAALSQLEEDTDEADGRAMRWLCGAIAPVVAAWGAYALAYHTYRSWWSWAIQVRHRFLLANLPSSHTSRLLPTGCTCTASSRYYRNSTSTAGCDRWRTVRTS